MPIYEYECPKCGRVELLLRASDPHPAKCECKSKWKRVPSAHSPPVIKSVRAVKDRQAHTIHARDCDIQPAVKRNK